MAVTSGFFNAVYSGSTPDRAYNAEQFGELFDGVLNDGIFSSVGDGLEVSAQSDMFVYVASGRAWFDHVWLKNSNVLSLEIPAAASALPRYDAVVIDINKNIDVRRGSIKIVSGTPAETPVKPTMIRDADHSQYPIAYVLVPAAATSILPDDVEDNRGNTDCPYASGMLSGISIIGQPEATTLAPTDVFLTEQTGGLKKITAENLLPMLMVALSPKNRRRIYRGKNLGSSVTRAQFEAIEDGSFDDLYIGDYWEISGVKYRIVDMDYWYNTGDPRGDSQLPPLTTHHLVMMPDTVLAQYKMNDTATTSGGYLNSNMSHEKLSTIRSTYLIPAFGSDHLLIHRGVFQSIVTNGTPTSSEWGDSRTEIPSEIQILGTHNEGAMSAAGTRSSNITTDKTQFALFDIDPSAVVSDKAYWLRDVVNSSRFACIGSYGQAGSDVANSSECWVRPVFGIIGGA